MSFSYVHLHLYLFANILHLRVHTCIGWLRPQLGKMRMQLPCRAGTCSHLQCFDATTFLMMNEKKATWTCPVCDRPAPFHKLMIDRYVRDRPAPFHKLMIDRYVRDRPAPFHKLMIDRYVRDRPAPFHKLMIDRYRHRSRCSCPIYKIRNEIKIEDERKYKLCFVL